MSSRPLPPSTPAGRLSPWTGGGTSPAPPPVSPGTLAPRIRTAPTRKGAAWTSPLCLATISPAGRRGSWGRCSHRGTRSSGTGGTASERGPQGAPEGAELDQVSGQNIPRTTERMPDLWDYFQDRARVSHLFGEEVVSHHDLLFNRDPGVSRYHRIKPGEHNDKSAAGHQRLGWDDQSGTCVNK